MTTAARWVLVALLVVHGLLHLLGVVEGFGWAQVSQLTHPVGPVAGVLWLLAALSLTVCAGLLAAGRASTWWWVVALCAAAVSQVAIVTSWDDAKVGTVVNLILLVAAGYGFASAGPTSLHTRWRQQAARAVVEVDPSPPLLTEADLVALPPPLADYVRRSGAVGKPRVTSLLATFHGRIRSGPGQPWMPFTGKQVSTYGRNPQRAFIIDATRSGLPVTVLHQFSHATATMRAKVLSTVTVVDAAGPQMDRSETVTVFNDLVVLAPGAIVDAPVRWTTVDAQHVRGEFTNGPQTVTAELTFDARHDLVDFVSDDRLRASADGTSFTAQRWSTPVSQTAATEGRRVLARGGARWDAPPPEGPFTYIELRLDAIAYNVPTLESAAGTIPVAAAEPARPAPLRATR